MLYEGRHGSTVLNPGDPLDPRDYHRGWADEALSPLGQLSAHQMADWFKNQPLDFIISCPLQRNRQTADIVSETCNVPVLKLDPRLMTWNVGVFAGQLATEQTYALLDMYQREIPWAKVPQGESYNTYYHRWEGGLRYWLDKSKDHDILLMTHHRNILITPTMLWGKPVRREGPPDPGGVMLVQDKELKLLFESPAEKAALHGNVSK